MQILRYGKFESDFILWVARLLLNLLTSTVYTVHHPIPLNMTLLDFVYLLL